MSVVVVGVDQQHAPLELLERVAVSDTDLPKALVVLRDRTNLSEVTIVSTCLRTEVYAVVDRFHDGVDELRQFLADVGGTDVDMLEPHLTVHFDDDVASHLFSVAAGLRSAVLGESEVLGQVRRAWERAHRERAAGPVLGMLFRHAVETGKRVRSETAIARGITSLSHGAVALAVQCRPGGLAGAHVVVVGAGEMGEGIVQAVLGHGIAGLVVVNRTRGRSATVLENATSRAGHAVPPMSAVPLSELAHALRSGDVVFTSVASPHPLVDMAMLAGTETPSGGPRVVVDLGVPRNVDPSVAGSPGIDLRNLDDVQAVVVEALTGRRAEVASAEAIVADEVERYREASRVRGAAPVIASLRSRAEEVRQAELERQRSRRADLTDEQWETIDAVTRATLAKLLHHPTLAVKDAAGTPRGERLVEAVRALFDL